MEKVVLCDMVSKIERYTVSFSQTVASSIGYN